jgi:hypothetical protein
MSNKPHYLAEEEDYKILDENVVCVENEYIKLGANIALDAAFDGGEIVGNAGFCCYAETTRPDHKDSPCIWEQVPFRIEGDGVRRVYEIDISSIKKLFFNANLIFKSKGHAKIYSLELVK